MKVGANRCPIAELLAAFDHAPKEVGEMRELHMAMTLMKDTDRANLVSTGNVPWESKCELLTTSVLRFGLYSSS